MAIDAAPKRLPGRSATELDRQFQEFLEYCLDQNRSRKTVTTYQQVLEDLMRWLNNNTPQVTSISLMDRDTLHRYSRDLRLRGDSDEELSPRTRAKYLAVIRSMLRYFAQETDEQVLPRDRVNLPKVGDHLPTGVPTPEEVDQMLAAAGVARPSAGRDRAIIGLLFSTGLRIAELCALNRADLREDDLGEEEVMEIGIVGKGRRSRVIFLSRRCQNIVKAYLDGRTDDSPALFIRQRPGKAMVPGVQEDGRLTPRSVEKLVRRCALKAGLAERITPHSLRHAFAIDLLLGGADLRTVQELLGHRSVTTTQIYTRLTNQSLREGFLRRRSLNGD
jgi:site-specific recombinase XerD